jgi:hypothetical protein
MERMCSLFEVNNTVTEFIMKKKKGFQKNSGQSEVISDTPDTSIQSVSLDAPRAIISQELLEQFERFYEYHPAKRFSRNLRSMLLEFLMYDGSAEAEYLRELMIDLDGLFSLLDAMEDDTNKVEETLAMYVTARYPDLIPPGGRYSSLPANASKTLARCLDTFRRLKTTSNGDLTPTVEIYQHFGCVIRNERRQPVVFRVA